MTKGSPDFKPAAWERVLARLRRDVPTLSADEAETALRAVGADRPRTLNRLDRYLSAHETGLLTPLFDCPAVIVRLTVRLAADGYTEVVPLGCSRCGQQADLKWHEYERICASCALQDKAFNCARCRAITHRVARLLPEGRICCRCYAKDPLARRPCSKCGRMRRPTRRLPDGGVLCQGCAPRPLHTCSRCGRSRPAHCITDEGPVCSSCYSVLKYSWICGLCGAVRTRQDKAALGPHVCLSCRRTRLRKAPVEAERAQAPASAHRRPRSTSVCAFCGRVRTVTNRWPAGPVCSVCSARTLNYPSQCAHCGQLAVLVGLDGERRRICGPCAGWKAGYRCSSCGQPGIKAHGLCSRCITRHRLEAVLAGPNGEVPDQLQPLVEALLSARDPRSVTVWLGKSSAATMLSQLARNGEPISHATLDSLSPSRHADYIREILVRTAILEPRNEYLDRLSPWIDHYLTNVPDHYARVLNAYAHWYLLHRARRRKGPLPRSGADRIRTRIRVAHEFLTWMDDHEHTLATLRQDLVDNWLASGKARHYEIRPFLHWTTQRGLTAEVSAPALKPMQPTIFLNDDHQLEQLHRCLTDNTIDIDLRAGGALMLLYGINLIRVLAITRNQIRERSGDHYINLTDHELLLPPVLAALLSQLPCPRPRSTLPEPDTSTGLLFPGRTPNRPVDAGMFGNRLKRHGINPRGGRNTAFIRLASELPAAVVADLLAIDITTATRWAKYARRDWHAYLAERLSDQPPRAGHTTPI
jgi:hypothetical protein